MTQFYNQRTMALAELSWSSQYYTYNSLLFWLFLTSWSIFLCVCLTTARNIQGILGRVLWLYICKVCILTIVQLQLIAWLWNKRGNENLTIISEPQHFQSLGIFIFFLLYSKCMQKSFTTKDFLLLYCSCGCCYRLLLVKTKTKTHSCHSQAPSHK